MKIVFLSNFYNHHQAFISRKLYELTDGNYYFISTEDVPCERKKLGYQDSVGPFVISYHSGLISAKEAQRHIDSADIVIVGSAPEHLLDYRKRKRKIILRYSERPLKIGGQCWKYPIRWYRFHKNNPKSVPIYVLCASAYAASDYSNFGLFTERTYKWGYFPECRKYDIDGLLSKKKTNTILWCGRFIDWKHPDDAIKVAYSLKKEGYSFHLNMIGAGDMEDELKLLVKELDLENAVHFLGSMPPDQVRSHMEEAGIYLFTSDRQEGWGAVLNEAMNSGCAIVASHSIGSVPYLLKHCENGMVYESGNLNMLFEKVTDLLCHPEKQRRLGFSAYHTIIDEWNADIAASRLIELIKSLMAGENSTELFTSGPCSFAENISDDYV